MENATGNVNGKPIDKNIWRYLPYITLRDIFAETRGAFGVWIAISIITFVFVGAFELIQVYFGFDVSQFDHSFLPVWAWSSIGIASLIWFMRGEEIHFVFPVFGIKSWLFFSSIVTAMFFTFANFQWWFSLPFFWALVITVIALDKLGARGKQNHEKMKLKNL